MCIISDTYHIESSIGFRFADPSSSLLPFFSGVLPITLSNVSLTFFEAYKIVLAIVTRLNNVTCGTHQNGSWLRWSTLKNRLQLLSQQSVLIN